MHNHMKSCPADRFMQHKYMAQHEYIISHRIPNKFINKKEVTKLRASVNIEIFKISPSQKLKDNAEKIQKVGYIYNPNWRFFYNIMGESFKEYS